MNPAWALLRLSSPQLPIGGYSYSQGLEMAVDNGRVSNPDEARRWISDQLLLNLARFEAPLLLAHCQAAAAENWCELRQLCESPQTNCRRIQERVAGCTINLMAPPKPTSASRP